MPANIHAIQSTAKLLLGLALIGAALTLYQWIELTQIRTGGATPFCSISATLDCAAIWNSPLSIWLQQYTGLPFAAFGLAFSLICFGLAVRLLLSSGNSTIGNIMLSLRIVTGTAAVIAIALLGYSLFLGIFCPTCVLFYLIVGASAYLAFKNLPNGGDWLMSGLHSAGWLAAAVLLLMYPGMKTPLHNATDLDLAQTTSTPGEGVSSPLATFLQSLEPNARQALADTLAMYKAAPLVDSPVDEQRLAFGNKESPVHIIEWLEIRCPHCKNLHTAMTEIRRISPPGSFSEDIRYFPLDNECNPQIERTEGSGVSCLAAKILICSKGSEGDKLRSALFEEQKTLTRNRIWDIAATNEIRRAELEQCIVSPETTTQLKSDIDFAQAHNLEGTPLVVINMRKAPAVPLLIYSLILAGGNANHPDFAQLPPDNPQAIEH